MRIERYGCLFKVDLKTHSCTFSPLIDVKLENRNFHDFTSSYISTLIWQIRVKVAVEILGVTTGMHHSITAKKTRYFASR